MKYSPNIHSSSSQNIPLQNRGAPNSKFSELLSHKTYAITISRFPRKYFRDRLHEENVNKYLNSFNIIAVFNGISLFSPKTDKNRLIYISFYDIFTITLKKS